MKYLGGSGNEIGTRAHKTAGNRFVQTEKDILVPRASVSLVTW